MLLVAALVLAPAAAARADHRKPCTVNGCGPGTWRIKVVPDRFLGCEFKGACDSHDTCYSQCMACGPRHDERVCVPPGPAALRDQCDAQLETDIGAANDSWYCRGFGWLFRLACHTLGAAHFGATGAVRVARALPSDADIAAVKANLEAILDYTDYRQDNPDAAARLETLKDPVRVLSQADPRRENRFVVKDVAGQRTLAYEAKRLPGPVTVRTQDNRVFVERRFLGEIETTNMRVNQQPVNLDPVIRTTPGVDPQKLDRSRRLEPVR
jgi:hypothetical protein